MKKPRSKNKRIEFIFPVLIFFIFTLSAMIVILFAAQIYQETVTDAAMNYNANTSLAYVSEKIHQHDNGNISIGQIDGCASIILREKINGELYATYIYAYDGQLRELFIKDGSTGSFGASSGQGIIEVRNFSAELSKENLISFSCEDLDGRTANACVGVYAGTVKDER